MNTLGELFKFGSGKVASFQDGGEFPIFGANGMVGLSRSPLYESGIILGRVGAYCGSVHYSASKFWATDNTIVAKPLSDEALDEKFGYYLLGHMNLNRYAGGAAQPLLTQTVLKRLEVEVPSLHAQRKIAAILSAYDDLIENNTRRVQVLEQMAGDLYREWFVEFRFPGHETAEFVEDEHGRRPEGWERVAFTLMTSVLSGGTPKTSEPSYWDGGIPFYSPKDSPDGYYVVSTEKTLTELGLSKCNSRLYSKDTVFITARGTVGKLALAAGDMAMNQSCYALVGKRGVSQYYLYLLTHELVVGFKKQANGAVFDAITVATFENTQVVRPTDEIIAAFTAACTPIFALSLSLTLRNANLRRTRDLLLPKLVSGELDVSALDVRGPGLEPVDVIEQTPEAVA
ncbi:restriction endonuclease subunit S [Deinococcus sp. UYEF24]